MATAEQLAKSISIEKRGIHVLLWNNQDDLVRSLLVLLAVLKDLPNSPLLLSSPEESVRLLRPMFELQSALEETLTEKDLLRPVRDILLIIFLQQATSHSIAPWLNGWRSALADEPGTLLVIRNADFLDFQRFAPDLASFFGPKIYDSSSMLSIWGEDTARRMKTVLPNEFCMILKELPGPSPSKEEIEYWLKQHPPLKTEIVEEV
ncbi:MAG: hypothetical protein C4527_03700 [Candidatus Omnitrophota bacterium]|jgi:hypothetical protein|nr:MAG: hypothetical protein C4527_03700 [Candidatus Omnitrophota bacterium]